jgi:DNA mismatch repair protein MutS
VVEQALRRQAAHSFVANDCDLSPEGSAKAGAIWLLTGPNMGGKSTFLRQNALIAILAQMGSFVPAKSAHIGIVDRLFSRVGASDDLARGRSTFMVEMVETAAILNQAGNRSLVILDEIGRGTATFDGLSIAWAAVEYLHGENRARAIFATHFHEMTALSEKLPRLSNVTMRVKEWEGDVVFLHEVGKGAADRSYGVQVARLAGLPDAVVSRARDVLHQLETSQASGKANRLVDDLPLFTAAVRREQPKPATVDRLREGLAAINPDELTPREALEALYRLKGMVS